LILRGAAALIALVGALCEPAPSVAQWLDRTPSPIESAPAPVPQEVGRSAVEPTLLSLALPGLGQHALGQRRQWAYFALEVVGWAAYLNRHGTAVELRAQYRDFAWANGRIQSGARVDGPFPYYEAVSKWLRSGAFDQDASTPGVQPELDPSTYNGAVWDRASRIYIPGGGPVSETDPAYQSAIAYYTRYAFGSAFLWDWSGSPDKQQEFAQLIHDSDQHFRQATTAIGVVIANHLIAAGDAYLSAHGRGTSARLRIEPSSRAGGAAWSAVLRIPWGG
jgi:hypothetical protein